MSFDAPMFFDCDRTGPEVADAFDEGMRIDLVDDGRLPPPGGLRESGFLAHKPGRERAMIATRRRRRRHHGRACGCSRAGLHRSGRRLLVAPRCSWRNTLRRVPVPAVHRVPARVPAEHRAPERALREPARECAEPVRVPSVPEQPQPPLPLVQTPLRSRRPFATVTSFSLVGTNWPAQSASTPAIASCSACVTQSP